MVLTQHKYHLKVNERNEPLFAFSMCMRVAFLKWANQTVNQLPMESAYCPYLIWKIQTLDAPNYAIDGSISNCLPKENTRQQKNDVNIHRKDDKNLVYETHICLLKFNAVENGNSNRNIHLNLDKFKRVYTLKFVGWVRCKNIWLMIQFTEIDSNGNVCGGLLIFISFSSIVLHFQKLSSQ